MTLKTTAIEYHRCSYGEYLRKRNILWKRYTSVDWLAEFIFLSTEKYTQNTKKMIPITNISHTSGIAFMWYKLTTKKQIIDDQTC